MFNQRTLDALLAAVAGDIVAGQASEICLHGHSTLVAEVDAVIATLDREVTRLNSDFGVERADRARFHSLSVPLGPAIFLQRINRQDGTSCLFTLGPYTDCLLVAREASADEVDSCNRAVDDSQRRTRLLGQGEEALTTLCDLLEERVRARMNHVCMHVDVRRTANKLLDQAKPYGSDKRRSPDALTYLAAACRATNVTVVEMLTEPELFG